MFCISVMGMWYLLLPSLPYPLQHSHPSLRQSDCGSTDAMSIVSLEGSQVHPLTVERPKKEVRNKENRTYNPTHSAIDWVLASVTLSSTPKPTPSRRSRIIASKHLPRASRTPFNSKIFSFNSCVRDRDSWAVSSFGIASSCVAGCPTPSSKRFRSGAGRAPDILIAKDCTDFSLEPVSLYLGVAFATSNVWS